jgi:hypothetical protein
VMMLFQCVLSKAVLRFEPSHLKSFRCKSVDTGGSHRHSMFTRPSNGASGTPDAALNCSHPRC